MFHFTTTNQQALLGPKIIKHRTVLLQTSSKRIKGSITRYSKFHQEKVKMERKSITHMTKRDFSVPLSPSVIPVNKFQTLDINPKG